MSKETEEFILMATSKSKHGEYQSFHPTLEGIIDKRLQPCGRSERERNSYMDDNISVMGKKVLDIGANTGYFSFAAIAAGAKKVVSVEGNSKHASFIKEAASRLGLAHKLEVMPEYYDFTMRVAQPYDVALCLNVIHHVGDDFGNTMLSIEQAKSAMIFYLNNISFVTKILWFQMGFNWKGDKTKPLFENGSKSELIQFVTSGTSDHWKIEKIGVMNPSSLRYELICQNNQQRFDHLGEFLNRPLFLLSSKSNL
jgi:SAM-dependent methyltransferase